MKKKYENQQLRDYAIYVAKVKSKKAIGLPTEKAVADSVNEAIQENLLAGFFKKHEKGVLDMTLTEFDKAEFIANRRAEGILETLVNLV